MKNNLVLLVYIVCFLVSCRGTKAPYIVNTENPGDIYPISTAKTPSDKNNPSKSSSHKQKLLDLQDKDKIKVTKNSNSFTLTNTRTGESITLTLTTDIQSITFFNNVFVFISYNSDKTKIIFGYSSSRTAKYMIIIKSFGVNELCSDVKTLEISEDPDVLLGDTVIFKLIDYSQK